MSFDLQLAPLLPARLRPICIVGAGGIVRDAHLPAYRKAGFQVLGIADPEADKARTLAAEYDIDLVTDSVQGLIAQAPKDAIYDLALPADLNAGVLAQLPIGSAVLIQKPMGETLEQAAEILAICRQRNLLAAVNFQLRFAPFVVAAKQLIDGGAIGELRDVEFRLNVHTPWELFPFMLKAPRLEIAYHSIHYIDCMRYFLGDPVAIRAHSITHPELDAREIRSSILMDYGATVRATISTNHHHRYGPRHQASFIKWEGTRGAIVAKMGLLMNYPKGVADVFEICQLGEEEPQWREIRLTGSWFPDAFIGSMAQMQCVVERGPEALLTPVDDAFKTMACMEAAYESSQRGGISPQYEGY